MRALDSEYDEPDLSEPAATTIHVAPPLEYGRRPELWEGVVEGLNTAGLSARLDDAPEHRGAAEVAGQIGIFVAEYAGCEVLDTIIRVLRAKLGGEPTLGTMKGEPRRVPIYGPDGRVLTEVEVPSEERGV